MVQCSMNWTRSAMKQQTPWKTASDWMQLGKYVTEMNLAAAQVISRRVIQMSQGSMSAPEVMGMILEKSTAFAAAGEKAAVAAAGGSDPVGIATAAIRPLHTKARSNARRSRG